MRCETCQHQNAEDANFCVDCGATLARRCPKCARRNGPVARFCAGCGLKLHGERQAPLPPPPVASPDAAARLNTRSAREGERKRVTMLFADIVGSTGLVERLDPEDAAAALGAVTTAMREAVARFEGTVNKMQGDGVMALFGAPIPQEDHAVRACCAALAMIENARGIEGAPAIRVGVHTGEVVVKALANDISVQYDAIGVAVHMAARLEQEAGAFGAAISKATLRAAGGAVIVEAAGDRQLRGISEPVPVYLLKGIRSTGTSQQFQGGQRLSSFVGRDLEMTVLRRALDAANNGASRVLGIVGEAGSGKSRMVFEFLVGCRNEGRAVLEARATAHGRSAPLQTVLNLMRTFFGIDEDMTAEQATLRVRTSMERVEAIRDTPLLLDFLGLPLASGEAVPTDIAGRRARLLDAVKHIARTLALAGPAVLVIEDLHWLDPASEPFVESIAQSVAGTRTLLLVDFRPGYRAAWMERSFYEQVSLVPLAGGAVNLMLDPLLGSEPALASLRDRIVDRAAGNPFFAEELVRALIERGALTGAPGAYRPSPGAQQVPLPETVQSLLVSRIDRLEERDKLLLQAAAIVGREFPLAVAAEIAETTESDARESLQRLLAAEMLYERPDLQRDAFAFRHPLVQEAAQGSLLSECRRDLHRRAAGALTAHFKERADETAALIASHWEEAGETMQAAAAYVKAALWIGTRDPRQALEAWRKVRRLLEGAPPAPPVDYMTMMACGQIVNYAWREGIDAAEVEPVFEQAMALARKLKDMRAAALITMAFGRVLAATGSAEEYVAKVEEAQKLVEGSKLPSVEAVLAAVYSHALSQAGHYERALAANEAALACVDAIDSRDRQTLGFHPEHWLTVQRARSLMMLDRIVEAEPLIDRLFDGEIGTVDTLHRVLALGVRIEGAARLRTGAKAMSLLPALDAMLEGNETPYLRVLCGRYRGVAKYAAGDVEGATGEWQAALNHALRHRAGLEMKAQIVALIAKATVTAPAG